jgi:hypothetical protein
MSKISELSDGGVIQGGDTLIAVRSGGNVKVTYGGSTTANIDGGTIDGTVIGGTTPAAVTGTTITGTSFVSSGDMTFGDSDKAIFGAGSDLQIYHTGSNSYIKDAGAGALIQLTNSWNLNNAADTQNMITATEGGDARLFYSGAGKLATTATGIDVTGTVTADGLTMASGSQGVIGVFGTSGLQLIGQTGSDNIIGTMGANEPLVFRTVSTEKMRIDSSGNVGIAGQTTPTYKLDGGFADQTWGWYLNSSYNAGFTYNTAERSLLLATRSAENIDHIKFATGSAATERVRIDGSGNVGIGTSSPTQTLEVTGGIRATVTPSNTVQASLLLANAATTSAANLQLNTSGGLSVWSYESGGAGWFNSATIDSSGNVGIGGTPTTHRLEVKGDNNIAKFYSDATATELKIVAPTVNVIGLYTGTADALTFGTADTERMRISSAGQLFLNVTAEVAAGYIASIKCAAGTGGVIIQNSNTTGVPLSFRDTSGGGIGSVSTTNTTTAYNTSSDQRLKENIVDANDAGDKIDAIQVRQYDWKVDGSHQDYGMVAQELMTVAPEAVSGDPESDEMMGVDYSKLVPMMLKEIQSLRARVAQLEGAN